MRLVVCLVLLVRCRRLVVGVMSEQQIETTHTPTTESDALSACVACGHRAIWHHDERGCQYHGNGPSRCVCRRTSDMVVARLVYEALTSAASRWFDAIVDGYVAAPSREESA